MDRSRTAATAGGHLDASAGQEVVYCHACSNEWYRREAGLECPRCESDITEVVDPTSDPRDFSRPVPGHASGSTSPEHPSNRFEDDSDPEEADIEDEIHDPSGFFFRRNVASGPDAHHHDPHFDHAHHHHHHHDHDHDHHGHEHVHYHQHHHPGHNHDQPDMDPIFSRFTEMFRGFAGPQAGMGGVGNGNGPRVQTTTFRHSNGTMNATVTMFSSGPMGTATNGGSGGDPFQQTFDSVMRDMDQPQGHPAMQNPHFTNGIHDLMSLLLGGGNGRAGDAVYTQEALDEIISNLMDQNPQQHGAPPATATALESLERKPVTKEMLDGEDKTDCTICLDDVKVGDQACFLPCKHWFHEDCVTAWLRAHNTCPVCRSPIETDEQRRTANANNDNNNNTRNDQNDEGNSGGRGPPGAFPEGEAPDPDEADPSSLNEDNAPQPPFATRPRMPQNPSSGPDVNDIIRAVSNFQQSAIRARQQQQHQHQPTHFQIRSSPGANFSISYGPPPNRSAPASFAANAAAARAAAGSRVQGNPPRPTPSDADAAYDTANLQRRTSFSPTATRAYVAGEGATANSSNNSRRERSPTRGAVSRQQSESEEGMSTAREGRGGVERRNSQGAFEWLRNRITGRGDRNGGDDGDRGR